MKIVHFSTSDNVGAFKATYYLHRALRQEGVESLLLVKRKTVSDDTVVQIDTQRVASVRRSFFFNGKRQRALPHAGTFHIHEETIPLVAVKKYLSGVDIICLHWINGLLSSQGIREIHNYARVPFVWTLMDIEPLTGGCHYSFSCDNYKRQCRQCPHFKEPLALYRKASQYEQYGDLINAEKLFKQLLFRSGMHKNILGGVSFHLGEIQYRLENLKKAEHYYKKCRMFIPFHNKARDRLRSIVRKEIIAVNKGNYFLKILNAFGESVKSDPSYQIWQKKYKNLSSLPITFVAGSSWLFRKCKESSLFSHRAVKKILLSVNDNIFKRGSKYEARNRLHLPHEKRIIFFGAREIREYRKGFEYLLDALSVLYDQCAALCDEILLVTAGGHLPNFNIPFQHKHLGFLKEDEMLALAFQAADVFACPSIEDAGPMMINQAVMCETPVVAFNTGVVPDLIFSGYNGYVAQKYSIEDFAFGLKRVLERGNNTFSVEMQDGKKRCTFQYQAKQYIQLFEELVYDKKVRLGF
ncbi:MAG: glycosyltransferase [Candidatus Omnitrophica bacterium]|nr:glycosyltransferase [Candidatus Omnitrophota bacterium]